MNKKYRGKEQRGKDKSKMVFCGLHLQILLRYSKLVGQHRKNHAMQEANNCFNACFQLPQEFTNYIWGLWSLRIKQKFFNKTEAKPVMQAQIFMGPLHFLKTFFLQRGPTPLSQNHHKRCFPKDANIAVDT